MYLVLWRISPWSTFLTEPRAQSGRHKRERRPIVCWLMINRAARECWINEISFTNIEHKAWLETPQPPVGDSHSGRQGDKEREKMFSENMAVHIQLLVCSLLKLSSLSWQIFWLKWFPICQQRRVGLLSTVITFRHSYDNLTKYYSPVQHMAANSKYCPRCKKNSKKQIPTFSPRNIRPTGFAALLRFIAW